MGSTEEGKSVLSKLASYEDVDDGVRVVLGQTSLIVPGRNEDLQIPLLCARVELLQQLHRNMALIAVTTYDDPETQKPLEETWFYGSGSEVWVIVTDNDPAIIRHAMEQLGSRGALRMDLANAFAIESTPLGCGACASVFRCQEAPLPGETLAKNAPYFALKVINDCSAKSVALMAKEVHLLMAVQQHPNIVNFRGVFCFAPPQPDGPASDGDPATQMSIMLELCPGGDLHDSIMQRRARDEHEALEVMMGLLAALAKVHSCGVVHRDVKAENILLAGDGRPILCDFGVAGFIDNEETMSQRCGSPGYVAPEILGSEAYGTKADIFSAGVVMYFMLAKVLPFRGDDVSQVLRRNLRCHINLNSSARFGRMSANGRNLLLALLKRDPNERPSASLGRSQIEKMLIQDHPKMRLFTSVDQQHRHLQRARTQAPGSTAEAVGILRSESRPPRMRQGPQAQDDSAGEGSPSSMIAKGLGVKPTSPRKAPSNVQDNARKGTPRKTWAGHTQAHKQEPESPQPSPRGGSSDVEKDPQVMQGAPNLWMRKMKKRDTATSACSASGDEDTPKQSLMQRAVPFRFKCMDSAASSSGEKKRWFKSMGKGGDSSEPEGEESHNMCPSDSDAPDNEKIDWRSWKSREIGSFSVSGSFCKRDMTPRQSRKVSIEEVEALVASQSLSQTTEVASPFGGSPTTSSSSRAPAEVAAGASSSSMPESEAGEPGQPFIIRRKDRSKSAPKSTSFSDESYPVSFTDLQQSTKGSSAKQKESKEKRPSKSSEAGSEDDVPPPVSARSLCRVNEDAPTYSTDNEGLISAPAALKSATAGCLDAQCAKATVDTMPGTTPVSPVVPAPPASPAQTGDSKKTKGWRLGRFSLRR